jgi:hypothetical protein
VKQRSAVLTGVLSFMGQAQRYLVVAAVETVQRLPLDSPVLQLVACFGLDNLTSATPAEVVRLAKCFPQVSALAAGVGFGGEGGERRGRGESGCVGGRLACWGGQGYAAAPLLAHLPSPFSPACPQVIKADQRNLLAREFREFQAEDMLLKWQVAQPVGPDALGKTH